MAAPQTTALQFGLDGMHCGSCVGRVEAALAGLDGVKQVRANLATHRVEVDVETRVSGSAIKEVLVGAGYTPQSTTHRFTVEGMHCASCVGRVENAFGALPDVISAQVNLASGTAQVEAFGDATTTAALLDVFDKSGYPATLLNDDSAADTSNRAEDETADLRRMVLIAGALTPPVFLLEMGSHAFDAVHHWVLANIGMRNSWLIQFVLTTIVLIWPGRQFFQRGLPALMRRAPDMNTLVALGAGAAWCYSTVALFAPSILPQSAAVVYFEAAAVIVTLILLGRWFEARAKGQTGQAIEQLLTLQPDTARVMRDGAYAEIPLAEVVLGDQIQLRPGDRVAVDGAVVDGSSYVDESMITGEPIPVEKAKGASVVGGTINTTGSLIYEATKLGDDMMLSQIIRMVQSAQDTRLPIQSLVNRITLYFVPAVLALAVITVIAWLIWGPAPALAPALVAGVAVLIIACPCAMGLATPMSIMVGTGRAAQLGVLFRQGDALQQLQDVKVVAFDKTGTLTEGRPALTDMKPLGGFNGDEMLAIVASVETLSEHPIATAIVANAQEKGLSLQPATDFEAIAGMGIAAQVDGKKVQIGAARFMESTGISTAGAEDDVATWAADGKTPSFVAVDGALAGAFAVSDPVRPTSASAIAALHKMGIKVAMITGDNPRAAQAIAVQLGIDTVHANLMPKEKVDAVNELRATGVVAFVGDGINDAPALAAADIGIAVGTGTDVAIEAADVVLMRGDPRAVVGAIEVSRATLANVRQNLFWAFSYNIALIPVAAGLFYPFFGWQLSPALAAGAMALSSVFVVTNALRLRWMKPAGA